MRRLGLIPILLVALPVTAGAQINIPAPERHGFWLGGGLGYAGAKLSCGLCATEDSRIGGLSGYLRAGYTVSPAFLLGAEVDVWSGSATPESDSDTTLSRFVGTLFATAYWYPSAKIGLFLKGGAGMVSFRAGGDELTVNAFGGTVGVGFEIPVAKKVSIVPFANYLDSSNGDLTFQQTVVGQASVSMWQLGIGATWH